MIKETTVIESEHAAKYLVTLCRHFARKVPATWNDEKGLVTFPVGNTEFKLEGERLLIICEAGSEESLEKVKGVVSVHVEMFSRRETLKLNWIR
ncbi:Enterobactin receptor VctA [Vibrio owensii]|uniref:DUF2218 domain-containing protein n=1 Tax=Vibrio owensii TaxID=696485 RepID=UPI0003AAE749|nr:DUF2218 domain-containing protein [Vibrio owensii]CAH1539132.1 Enterobactin receptor VctA [Vibrio owensii]CAH1590411.1 Enterobactin receptor VctA [Vibrio owensii]